MGEGQYGEGQYGKGQNGEGQCGKVQRPGTTKTNEFLIRCDGAHLQRT